MKLGHIDMPINKKRSSKKKSGESLRKTFQGRNILVTGGCGSIGREVVKHLLKYKPNSIRILDNNESGHFFLRQEIKSKITRHLIGDIRDKNRVELAMKGVDIVFHAAALKHVPLSEYNPYEAITTNIIGTQNIINAARNEKVRKVISISTDKAANPINTMGATKLLSEKLIASANRESDYTRFASVRFGNVLNSVGSVIPIFKQQISSGGPVTITSDKMTRFFMSMSEAVNLILQACNRMNGGEVFILKMKSLRIIDLADVMIMELAERYDYNPDDIRIRDIGVRPGEKISECLVTKEETGNIEDSRDMFILWPSVTTPNFILNYQSKRKYSEYDSNNIPQLSKEEIKDLLYKYKII